MKNDAWMDGWMVKRAILDNLDGGAGAPKATRNDKVSLKYDELPITRKRELPGGGKRNGRDEGIARTRELSCKREHGNHRTEVKGRERRTSAPHNNSREKPGTFLFFFNYLPAAAHRPIGVPTPSLAKAI